MKSFALLVLAALGLHGSFAAAAPYYFGAHYQWAQTLGPSSFKDSTNAANGLGLLGGYKLNNKWAAEINYDRPVFGNVEMTHSLISAAGVYRFKQGFAVPYARLGLGIADNSFDAAGVETKKTFAGHVGGGIEFNFKPVTVYTGLRFNYVGKVSDSVSDASSANLLVGLMIPAFGTGDAAVTTETSSPVELVKNEIQKVIDTDGDGINDDKDKCPGSAAGVKVNAYGCAEKEKATVRINVEFLTGKADVQPQYESEIEKLGAFMKEFPETKVEIAGHTDNTGSVKTNNAMSKKRAQAIADVLVSKYGIDKKRLTVKGYGPSKPVADNSTEEGRKTNRRVEAEISN